MLQTIHDRLKGVFAIVVLGALAVVFVFWGVEFVSLGFSTTAKGLQVNGKELDVNDVRRVYQEQLARVTQAFGAQEVPADVRAKLQQDVLEGSVRRELIRERTEKLRFRASDLEVFESLKEIPAFLVDGKFSKDAYYAALRAENIELVQFEAEQRQSIAARQLDRGISASAFLLPQEIKRVTELKGEQRELAWVIIPTSRFLAGGNPDQGAMDAWYAKNKQRFLTEEKSSLQYIELSLTELSSQVQVTDEALHAYYDQNKDRYLPVERRQARHILITPGKDEAAASKLAQELYARAQKGEDFAELAKKYSQDPGSAPQGGDLGLAEKSMFVAAFADAVWSMKAGEIHAPVKTEFGWHVIKLERIEAGSQRSFDEVRAELETEYRRAEAEKLFGDLQEQLDTASFEAGGNLQQVADRLKLPVKVLPDFTRSSKDVPFAGNARVIEAAFDPEMTAGSKIRVVETGEGLVAAIRVAAHEPPQERPLADVREAVLQAMRTEMALPQAASTAAALVQQLDGGTAGGEAARGWATGPAETNGLAPRFVRRDDPAAPKDIVTAAFKAGRPEGKPRYGSVKLSTGDVAVWAAMSMKPGSNSDLTAEQRVALLRDVRERIAYSDASVYIGALRATAEVKSDPKLFD
jgi:peptidyl-prolyl cis-trans isomerase D